MGANERDKWDQRYREGAYEGRTHPTALLADWLSQLPRGRALDVACGTGRNALFLASHGFDVDAVDISAVALERARSSAAARQVSVHWHCLDLDRQALPPSRYNVIVWVRYVNRSLMGALIERLEPGGILLCEQHLTTELSVAGPANPAFRLQPGELLRSTAGLRTRHYLEGPVVDPDGRTVALAQIVASAD